LISDNEKSLKDDIAKLSADINEKISQISQIQFQLEQLATKQQKLTQDLENLHRKYQHLWTPAIALKGVIVTKQTPKYSFKEAKETDHTVLICSTSCECIFHNRM